MASAGKKKAGDCGRNAGHQDGKRAQPRVVQRDGSGVAGRGREERRGHRRADVRGVPDVGGVERAEREVAEEDHEPERRRGGLRPTTHPPRAVEREPASVAQRCRGVTSIAVTVTMTAND